MDLGEKGGWGGGLGGTEGGKTMVGMSCMKEK